MRLRFSNTARRSAEQAAGRRAAGASAHVQPLRERRWRSRLVRGSPNSAIEAGSRLLQYVVDRASEDTPHSSIAALPRQPFFPLLRAIAKIIFNGTNVSKSSLVWARHPSGNESFS